MNICEICKVSVKSEIDFKHHLEGKAHQKAEEALTRRKELAARSVFISPYSTTTAIDEESIKQLLGSVPFQRILIDKKKGKYAIVEFQTVSERNQIISARKLMVNGNTFRISERKCEYSKQTILDADPVKTIEVYQLCSEMQNLDFGSKFRRLYDKVSCSSSEKRRKYIVTNINRYLNEHFESEIQLTLFGSVVTGLGIRGCDLDMCLNIDGFSTPLEDITLLSTDVHLLRSKNIRLDHFSVLSKKDKTRLLTRILNEYRKETGKISDLVGVPDGHCPVIRFVADQEISCELSVDNQLSIHKANFVIKAVGNGELFQLLFLFRLWAHCNNLFYDPNEPKGAWSSYALSLIFISFCQKEQLIGPVVITDDLKINGWNIHYEVKRNDQQIEPSEFLMRLFKYVVTLFNQPTIVSMRSGIQQPIESNTEPDFKIGLANVQDPIELSHNVTMNVAKHYITLLRSRGLDVIKRLKSVTDPFISLFSNQTPTPSNAESAYSLTIPNERIEELTEKLDHLLTEIMQFQPVDQSKRQRFTDQTEVLCHSVTYPIWIGRRSVRRSIQSTQNHLSKLDLERQTTETIMRSSTELDYKLQLTTKISSSLPSLCRISLDCDIDNTDSRNLLHFLCQFLKLSTDSLRSQ